MTIAITKRRYPEIHRALCALLGERKQFKTIDHFETWLPKMDDGLGLLRHRTPDAWHEFVCGKDLARILEIRDTQNNLRGAHQFLDYMAN